MQWSLCRRRMDIRKCWCNSGSVGFWREPFRPIATTTRHCCQSTRHDDAALLPVNEFFRLAEIPFKTEGDSAVVVVLYPSGQQLRIALGDTLVTGPRGTAVIGPDDLIERQGELYLATERLGELLGLKFLIDWSQLYVLVEDPSSLPLVLRLERDATRRAMLRTRAGGSSPDLMLPTDRSRWSGIVADYALTMPADDPLAGSSYALALGSGALGGSLEFGVRSLGAASSGKWARHRRARST